ncbi:MAG: serine protease [Candidatus Melainabacteria bacterium]|nr:serine protease [Candidatus Melainabacteria bacterium]
MLLKGSIIFSITLIFLSPVFALEPLEKVDLKKLRDAIVFIFEAGSDPCTEANQALPIGTGFMVSISTKADPSKAFKYVMTNAHILRGRDKVVVRYNDTAGNRSICQTYDVKAVGIFPTDSSVDLAAIPVGDVPNTFPVCFDHGFMLGTEQLKTAEIEEGTEVVALGYLEPYAGYAKNFPVMRFGKLALLSEERWWRASEGPLQKGYVTEIYNMEGASGSPVVLQPSQIRVNRNNVLENRRIDPFLIGVIKGYPNAYADIVDVDLERGTKKRLKSFAVVSSGVAVMEPAQSVREFLESLAKLLDSAGYPTVLTEPFKPELVPAK